MFHQGEVFLVALDGNLIVVCGCSYVSARGFDALGRAAEATVAVERIDNRSSV